VHRQQPGSLVDWKPTVRPGFDLKMGYSGIFFVKEEKIARINWAGIRQLMRLITSTDQLHVHPLRMQPRGGTEALKYFSFHPFTGRIAHTPQAGSQEAATEG
jgi:hypothetical protein